MSEMINGYPVLAAFNTPADIMTAQGRFVLVDRGHNCVGGGDYHRWVTWWQNTENPEKPYCVGGHYFSTLDAAKADFAERCRGG